MKKTINTKLLVTLYDVLLGAASMYAVIKLRYIYENKTPPNHIDISATIIFALAVLIVWLIMRAYRPVWRFMSFDDVKILLKSVIWASLLTPLIMFLFFNRAEHLPRSVPFIAGGLFFVLLVASRIAVLIYNNGDIKTLFRKGRYSKPPALLIGRSQALHDYIRDEQKKPNAHYYIHGLIETGGDNKGRSIRAIPVLGNLDDIEDIAISVEQLLGIKPSLIMVDTNIEREKSADLVKRAAILGARLVRVRPGRNNELTPFEAADLIGRQAKTLDMSPVEKMLQNKCVLITGAGGTIGSELVRQISVCKPRKMVLIDASEMNLYTIDRELSEQPDLSYRAYLGDIRDKAHMNEIFAHEKPEIVIHAAALKHVPLMEANPISTVMTNVGGTKIILDMAKKHQAESFTLISTDKAVSPNNIMGASKRIAELLTLANNKNNLSALAVRFGNVLASNGSVIPLFEKQIEQGGPVTVTDKNVTRFFMTKEEAASLVLQATALNAKTQNAKLKSAKIYVLDMGEPVNITRLARQLIRLRGLVPDKDIKIKYTGLRAGEKLEEKLTSDYEFLRPTEIDGILVFADNGNDEKTLGEKITTLLKAATKRDKNAVKKALSALVPEFTNGDKKT